MLQENTVYIHDSSTGELVLCSLETKPGQDPEEPVEAYATAHGLSFSDCSYGQVTSIRIDS